MGRINTWPGWECVRTLGSGAFGTVYEIQKIENGKTYTAALKVISIPQNEADVENAYSEGMDKENVTKYFKSLVNDITNEVALMADLKGYTHIVSYEDHMVREHQNGIGWDILIRMELLTPLTKWVMEHPMSEDDVTRLGRDICRALELCHKNHIIHRDIKPENIFVNKNGDFKLGDFGIARVADKTSSVMSQKGTYTYMAPEVFKGQHYNETVDIYSLGIVLYRFMNNNRTPFLPQGALQFTDRQIAQEKRMSGEVIPAPINGSSELKKVVLKALEFEPKERTQSALEFRKALEYCYASRGVQRGQTTPSVEDVEIPPVQSEPSIEIEPEDETVYRKPITPKKNSEDEPTYWGPTTPKEEQVTQESEDENEFEDEKTVLTGGAIPEVPKKSKKWILPVVIGVIVLVGGIIAASVFKPTTENFSSSDAQNQENSTDSLKENEDEGFTWEQKEDEEASVDNEKMEIEGELQVVCTTNILLVGDTVRLAVGTDSFLFDNATKGLQFYSSNTNVATVDSLGVVTGKSAGVVNLTAVYEDKEAICQLYIADEQPSGRGVIIDTEYERISMDYYEDVTVEFTLYGDVPENFGMSRYCSGNMLMTFEWGELKENVLPLTICALQGDGTEGTVTVLLYSKDNPKNVISSTSFTVKAD